MDAITKHELASSLYEHLVRAGHFAGGLADRGDADVDAIRDLVRRARMAAADLTERTAAEAREASPPVVHRELTAKDRAELHRRYLDWSSTQPKDAE